VKRKQSIAVTPYAALTDPKLFAPHFSGESWRTWLTVIRGAFGEKLEGADLELWRRVTARETVPTALRELWAIVGRRGGKDATATALALILACCRDWRAVLRAGETAVGMIICPDRRQGRVALGYIRGYLDAISALGAMVESITAEAVTFKNGIRIEIHTASFRSVRGYTVAFTILDELAFFRDETSANPDAEILAALRPAMATVPRSVMICLSTPYARRGELHRAHKRFFGREHDGILVVKGPTQLFNPTVAGHVISDAFAEDPIGAASEFGSLEDGIRFRSDVEAFVPREVIDACTVKGRVLLPPLSEQRYYAFVDPSGGSSDSMTLAIAHREGRPAIKFESVAQMRRDEEQQRQMPKYRYVLDCVLERRPPFSPDQVVEEFAEQLRAYRITSVTGDRYGGEWPRERFRVHGIAYRSADASKSEIYQAVLPLLTSGRAELLDQPRLLAQIGGLERRTSRSGKDSIDHSPGSSARDDVSNSALGALWLAERAASRRATVGRVIGA
jgi:hypothetical protein